MFVCLCVCVPLSCAPPHTPTCHSVSANPSQTLFAFTRLALVEGCCTAIHSSRGFQLLAPTARHSHSTGRQQLNSPGVSRRRLQTRLCPRCLHSDSSAQDASAQLSWTYLSHHHIRSKHSSAPDPRLGTEDSSAGSLSRSSPASADLWCTPPLLCSSRFTGPPGLFPRWMRNMPPGALRLCLSYRQKSSR